MKVQVTSVCDYCGASYQWMARSKAEAGRSTGKGVCARQDCRDANTEEIKREFARVDTSAANDVPMNCYGF